MDLQGHEQGSGASPGVVPAEPLPQRRRSVASAATEPDQSTPPMQIRVLGPVRALVAGRDVHLGPRQGHVLAVLALDAGHVVSVDRLVDVVWPGVEHDAATARLRTTVTRLRRVLDDPDRITYREPGYVLRLDPGELDRDLFLGELDEAGRAYRAGDVERAGALVDRSLGRWEGPPLAGFDDEPWAQPTRARLEERRADARALQVQVMVATGRADEAVAAARALVADGPLRERPRELLMVALYHAGRQAEALDEYRTFRDFLADETGLDPSDSLASLQERVLRGDLPAGPTVELRGYELGARIGEGAHAVVHRATQPGVGREVAVKVIRAALADDPDFVRRFDVEARTIARIEHPHVVPLYDYWREPGGAYLVMRLMRGGSLERALLDGGPLAVDHVIRLLQDVGGALAAAHDVGVVHRDVRPANVLLDHEGRAYLADFGIARDVLATERHDGASASVPDAATVDHPAYAAPEVLRGDPVTTAADVLSLGVTAFEALAGHPPFADSPDRTELVRRQLREPLPSTRSVRPDLPPGLDGVLARATAKAPGSRHPTAVALVRDLVAVLDTLAATTVQAASTTPRRPEDVANPYVGLRAFDEADADRFFGRAALVAELVDAVAAHRLVTVVGPSGSGKSSVVRAGLLPALRDGAVPGSETWFATTMVPGADPVASFEAALVRVAVDSPASLRDVLADDGGLLRAVRHVLPDAIDLLLVVDQFEEVFTQTTDDPLRERFLDELAGALAAPDTPLHVVATVRADHFDRPLRHRALAELVSDAVVPVRPLAADDLERVIVGPPAREGVRVETALVAELVAAVADRPAALPLLQFSLTELFERRDGDLLRQAVHHDLGGLAGAVAARADRILDAGGPGTDEAARRIFGRLVTLGEGHEDTRRRARVADLADDDLSADLLEAFVAARLLVTDRDPSTREPTVEIAHEALLREWPRLRGWIDKDRTDLATLHDVAAAATTWDEAQRDRADLARGARLELAEDLATRRPDWITATEAAWVDASRLAERERVERDRRQARRLRRALVAATGLLVLALVAAGTALVARNEATDNEAAAQRAASDAEAAASEAVVARRDGDVERLAALSGDLVDTQRDVAILLALEAVRRRPDAATHTALHQALAADARVVAIHRSVLDGSSAVSLGVDGRFGVAWSQDQDAGRIQFVEMPDGTPRGDPIETPFGIGAAAIAGDGSVVAVATDEPAVRRYTPDGRSSVIGADVETDLVRDPWLTLSDDGDRVAWNERQEAAHVHDATRDDVVWTTTTDAEWPFLGPVAISPDGTHVAVARSGNVIHGPGAPPPPGRTRLEVHDVDTGEVVARSDVVDLNPLSIALADDGTVMAGFREGVPVRWPSRQGATVRELGAHDGFVIGVAVSANGLGVSIGDDATAQLWTGDGRRAGRPIGLQGEGDQVSFPDDGTLLFATLDGTTLEVHPNGSVLATDTIVVDEPLRFTNTGLPYLETFPEDLSGYRLRSYEDGSVVHEVDLGDDFPNGIGPFSWWGSRSRNGEWTLRYGPDGDGGAITGLVNTDGTVRRMFPTELGAVLAGDRDGYIGSYQRPTDDGERLLVIAIVPGESVVGWFDTRTGDLVEGPTTIRALNRESNESVLLADGTAVVGDRTGALLVLPPDLDEVVEVPGGTGYNALDVVEEQRRVLLGHDDGRVALLDVDTGEIDVVASFDDFPLFGAVSPDGARAQVHFTNSGSVLVDLVEQAPLGVTILEGLYNGEAYWDDDSAGIWMTNDQGVSRYSADPQEWVELACDVVQRDLTADEWRRHVEPDTDPVSVCT